MLSVTLSLLCHHPSSPPGPLAAWLALTRSHRHIPAVPGAEVGRAVGVQGGDEELARPPAHATVPLQEPGVPPALRRGAAAAAAAGWGGAVVPQG